MIHYFVAQIRINDLKEYDKYLENVDEVFSRYNVEYLAIDDYQKILKHRLNSASCDTILIKGIDEL